MSAVDGRSNYPGVRAMRQPLGESRPGNLRCEAR
jgi:hypothetical protein